MNSPTGYRSAQLDELSIFYREAGRSDAPTLLLLHGLPSSSRMFEPLLLRLSERYHLVAPDYPGFGHSDWPAVTSFTYTFDHIAEIVSRLTETLGLQRYALYMQDYGGPVGFRMALAHPERVSGLIVQNAVTHNEGLGPAWNVRRAFWEDREANEAALRQSLLSFRQRGPVISELTRTSNSTIPIYGRTNSRSSASPARQTFKATCSTTTAPTFSPTPNGTHGCGTNSRPCLSLGAATIHPSHCRKRTRTDVTSRALGCMCWRQVTSHSTPEIAGLVQEFMDSLPRD
jgi:pimeloyl-ACP methyl ester carboxylesterase